VREPIYLADDRAARVGRLAINAVGVPAIAIRSTARHESAGAGLVGLVLRISPAKWPCGFLVYPEPCDAKRLVLVQRTVGCSEKAVHFVRKSPSVAVALDAEDSP